MYKLLAIDLDGTLLDDSNRIPANNITAVEKALSNGVNVALCSGRSLLSLRYFEEQLGLNKPGCYGICFNGSMVYETDTHSVIHELRMKNEAAQFLIRELRYFDADIVAYAGKTLYAENETPRIKAYIQKSRIRLTLVKSFEDIREDISKVLIKGENDELHKVSRFMRPTIIGRASMSFSSHDLLEFNHPDVNKGYGITQLAGHLGIQTDEVIGVGDGENDMELIRCAGMGIAVANADPCVKEAADYICEAGNNDGALEEVVARFILC